MSVPFETKDISEILSSFYSKIQSRNFRIGARFDKDRFFGFNDPILKKSEKDTGSHPIAALKKWDVFPPRKIESAEKSKERNFKNKNILKIKYSLQKRTPTDRPNFQSFLGHDRFAVFLDYVTVFKDHTDQSCHFHGIFDVEVFCDALAESVDDQKFCVVFR